MAARYLLSPAVQKALKEKNITAEEVIRKALNIHPDGIDVGDGVSFPEGTAFLAWYKDRAHWGLVKHGFIVIEGESFSSISGAAAKITGRSTTNGWDFWLVKVPGKRDFVAIDSFRNKNPAKK